MLHEHPDFFECPLVDQELDTFTGGELPLLVLIFNSLFAAPIKAVDFLSRRSLILSDRHEVPHF